MIFNEGKYNFHWKTKQLIELGAFNRGKSRHRPRNAKELFEGGTYPFIQTGDVKNANLYIDKHFKNYNDFGLKQSSIWPENTLCITIAANIAETAILSYPMCFPDSVVGFNAYENETSEIFMHYVFKYIKNSIQNSVIGSIQDNINIDYLKNLKFKIPKKEIQDKIVLILSNLDKKIELNNKIINILTEESTDIYMHLFFKKTTNGTIKDILIENPKSSIQVRNAKDKIGKHPFFTSGEAILEYEESLIDGRNCYLNTGGNADVKFYVGKAAYSTDTWCISAKNELIDYLFLLLNCIKIELSKKFFKGTGLKHLQKELLKNRPIYIPSKEEVKKFNEIIQPKFDMISEKNRENKELINLRDWILPLLMNGQVRIK